MGESQDQAQQTNIRTTPGGIQMCCYRHGCCQDSRSVSINLYVALGDKLLVKRGGRGNLSAQSPGFDELGNWNAVGPCQGLLQQQQGLLRFGLSINVRWGSSC